MADRNLHRAAGLALVGAGLLTMIVNALFTPQLPQNVPPAQVAALSVFAWRQSLAAVAAMLLVFGSMGVHGAQSDRSGRFGAAAFALACTGSALLLATEWLQLTLLRDLAIHSPAAVNALDDRPGLGPDDLGALIAFLTFVLGWIALAASTLRAGVLPRRGPALLIAGFFVSPLLGALGGQWGLAVGALIPAAGWVLMGTDLRRHGPPAHAPVS